MKKPRLFRHSEIGRGRNGQSMRTFYIDQDHIDVILFEWLNKKYPELAALPDSFIYHHFGNFMFVTPEMSAEEEQKMMQIPLK